MTERAPIEPVLRRRACAAFLLLGLVSCGGGGDPAPPVTPPPPPTSGLDQRPSNTTCLAGDRPTTNVTLAVQRAFPNLSFTSPVLMLQAPRDTTRWFVVEQAGRIARFANDANATTSSTFVDITPRVTSGGETGLLGLAFHPNFPTDPRAYLSYTTGGTNLVSRISEFRTRDGGATLDPASEVVLMTVNQPASNHNGGNIGFGNDGFLYIGFGDGGSGGDPWGTIGNGQNMQTLLGKMLRIDVAGPTGATPYRIPAGNVFASGALCGAAGANGTGASNCAEIYASGFRNPWRWSFDRDTGELWVGDVGQNAWEEVDRVVAGGNYGWRCREGANPFNSTCGPATGLLDPIAQYDHNAGQSITGGYVYKGSAIPGLANRYVFGDFASGRIWTVPTNASPTITVSAATTGSLASGLQIAAFGQGADGELYVVNYAGTLHRLVQSGASGGGVATQLSATGCVAASNATQAASGLIPYAPNAPFWSDGAAKDRWIALPNGQNITVGADGDWDFPNGTVLMKSFRLGSRLVETRLFMRHNDGVWAGYSYEWNAGQTDATMRQLYLT